MGEEGSFEGAGFEEVLCRENGGVSGREDMDAGDVDCAVGELFESRVDQN